MWQTPGPGHRGSTPIYASSRTSSKITGLKMMMATLGCRSWFGMYTSVQYLCLSLQAQRQGVIVETFMPSPWPIALPDKRTIQASKHSLSRTLVTVGFSTSYWEWAIDYTSNPSDEFLVPDTYDHLISVQNIADLRNYPFQLKEAGARERAAAEAGRLTVREGDRGCDLIIFFHLSKKLVLQSPSLVTFD